MRAEKAAAGKERAARDGSLESRMAMRVGRGAISTHASPSPPPEYVDLRHRHLHGAQLRGYRSLPPSQGDWDHFTGIDARVLKAPESGNLGTLLMRARAPR